MFRYLLSWRYLVRRRTNLIAIVGLFLAVGALIMILSIMTGFLEEGRRVVRGSLSDVVVQPFFSRRSEGRRVRDAPREVLDLLLADERVAAAAPRLSYFGILNRPGYVGTGGRADTSGGVLARTGTATLAGVRMVGIDVATPARVALGALVPWLRLRGFPATFDVLPLTDEFATTELFEALTREPERGRRVRHPALPFLSVPRAEDEPASARNGRELPVCVVGEQLYAALGLEVGQVIEVLTVCPDERGGAEQRAGRFTVAGTFRFGQNEADLSRIYVARDDLRRMLASPYSYSEISARLLDYERDGRAVCADLGPELAARSLIRGDVYGEPGGTPEYREVRTWETFQRNLLASIENQRAIMAVLLSLVLLVAGFTVFAILSMMVNEKRRDVGVLAALGATPRALVAMFLMIAVWDVLLGAAAGAAVGTWAALEIDSIERWLSSVLGIEIMDRSLYLFDTIPSQVEPDAVALILVGTLALSVVAALIPAWRASRLDPLQAVRLD